jgi:hypothetical protein
MLSPILFVLWGAVAFCLGRRSARPTGIAAAAAHASAHRTPVVFELGGWPGVDEVPSPGEGFSRRFAVSGASSCREAILLVPVRIGDRLRREYPRIRARLIQARMSGASLVFVLVTYEHSDDYADADDVNPDGIGADSDERRGQRGQHEQHEQEGVG